MTTSYNGWTASATPTDFGGLVPLVVAGESFAPGVRAGDVAVIFSYLTNQLHARVEPVYAPGWHTQDDWGYSYRQNRNANNLSCHASGTAIDYNATRHPNDRSGTFTAAQVAEIRRILAELRGVVRWGGDFSGTRDEMHFEIVGTAAQVRSVADILRGAPAKPTNAPVVATQRALHFIGAEIDGYWGEQTEQGVNTVRNAINGGFPFGVIEAQTRVGAKPDGDWGDLSRAALTQTIKELQAAWGAGVDGAWGANTEARYQANRAAFYTGT